MGNGGLYSFAYIYLTGNPVTGEALVRRIFLALVGYLICGAILFAKHRDQHTATRFHHVVRKFDLVHTYPSVAAAHGTWSKSGNDCRAGLWSGAFYVDGICLRIIAVRIPIFGKGVHPFLTENCRSNCGFSCIFRSLFDLARIPARVDGTVRRTVSGILYGLPV